jgi:hypothetical protein
MTKLTLAFFTVLVVGSLGYCTREDGLPDPPPQQLLPCQPDAGSEEPLACPPPLDSGVAAGD